MLKRCSLSTEDGRERIILFATFPSSWNMLQLVFHHLKESTSPGWVEDSKICPVHFSVSADDLRPFLFFEVCFYTFCTDVCIWWQIIKARVKVVHVNRRVTGSRVYIIRIYDLWDQLNISGDRAAICLHSFVYLFAKTRHSRARLTVRHAFNWTNIEQGLNTNQTSVLSYLHHRVG